MADISTAFCEHRRCRSSACHPCLRVRRLRHAVRRSRRRRAPPRRGRPRRRPVLGALAGQAARIHLDSPLAGRYVGFWTLTQRALDYCFERFPSVDRRCARPARRLSQARRLPRCRTVLRALKARGEQDRHPVQRLAGHARRLRSRRPGSATSSTRCSRSTRSGCSSRGRRSMRWSPEFASRPPTWCSCPRTAGTSWARPRSASAPSGSTAAAPDEYPDFPPVKVVRELSALAALPL